MLRQLFDHLTLLFDVNQRVIVHIIRPEYLLCLYLFFSSSHLIFLNLFLSLSFCNMKLMVMTCVLFFLSILFFSVPDSILLDYGPLDGTLIPIKLRLSEISSCHYGATKSVYVSFIWRFLL